MCIWALRRWAMSIWKTQVHPNQPSSGDRPHYFSSWRALGMFATRCSASSASRTWSRALSIIRCSSPECGCWMMAYQYSTGWTTCVHRRALQRRRSVHRWVLQRTTLLNVDGYVQQPRSKKGCWQYRCSRQHIVLTPSASSEMQATLYARRTVGFPTTCRFIRLSSLTWKSLRNTTWSTSLTCRSWRMSALQHKFSIMAAQPWSANCTQKIL